MQDEPEIVITISKQTFDAVQTRAWGTMRTDTTTYNQDGTVSFSIAKRVLKNLELFNADPDLAIRAVLGLKTN